MRGLASARSGGSPGSARAGSTEPPATAGRRANRSQAIVAPVDPQRLRAAARAHGKDRASLRCRAARASTRCPRPARARAPERRHRSLGLARNIEAQLRTIYLIDVGAMRRSEQRRVPQGRLPDTRDMRDRRASTLRSRRYVRPVVPSGESRTRTHPISALSARESTESYCVEAAERHPVMVARSRLSGYVQGHFCASALRKIGFARHPGAAMIRQTD